MKNQIFISPKFHRVRKGFALFHVLIVITILSLVFLAVNMMFKYNHRQIMNQERNLRAHYIAYSGASLGYTAITDDANLSLLEEIASKTSETTGKKTDIEFDDPKSKINLTSWFDDGKIIIKSEAELEESSTKSTIYMIFEKNDPNNVSWKKRLD